MAAAPSLGPYVLLQELGSGTTGKVRLAKKTDTGEHVAIKIISKASFEKKPSFKAKVQREMSLMRLFEHPNLLKLVDVLESPRHMYIVIEYAANGELFDYLISNRKLPDEVAARIFRQIIYGLEYLHSLGICHRDLKPENILLDENLNVKIADFGFAKFLNGSVTETACGSPHYAAPEVIKGESYDGKRADVWSCGVILYALLAGFLPFDDKNIRILLSKVKSGKYQMPPVSDIAKDFISKLLVLNPAHRLSIDEMKEHPFFRIGLPDEYIVPSPLPVTWTSGSVDPETVSMEVVELLQKIGFEDEEQLIEDLQCPEHTMAKVFNHMLTSRFAVDQLDWSRSVGADDVLVEDDELLMDPALPMDEPSSSRQGSLNPASFSCATSVPYTPDWAIPEAKPVEFSQTHEITVNLDHVSTMLAIQVLMSRLEMQFFHPDEYMIVSRREDVGHMYVVFQCVPLEEMETGLRIQLLSGTAESFDLVCCRAEEVLAEVQIAFADEEE